MQFEIPTFGEPWKDKLVKEFIRTVGVFYICNNPLYERALRLCKTKSDVIRLYKRSINWCVGAKFPSLEYLREYQADQEDEGLFIDKEFHGETLSTQQAYIFHNCKGVINVEMSYDIERPNIPMLYFLDGCEMTITCHQDNKGYPIEIPVNVAEGNKIHTEKCKGAIFKRSRLKW